MKFVALLSAAMLTLSACSGATSGKPKPPPPGPPPEYEAPRSFELPGQAKPDEPPPASATPAEPAPAPAP